MTEPDSRTAPTAPLDSPFDLTGRRALVTGSTRGIGASIAAAFVRAGANVIIHGRDADRAAAAAARLRDTLPEAEIRAPHAVAFDVTDHAAMLAAVSDLEGRLGGIDILVNNAGIQHRADLLEFPLDAWQAVLSANLTSCFVLAQHVARGMVARGHGKIINICSVQNKLVRASTAAYAAAKSGLGTLGQVMCADWAAHGIQVNGLAPGYINTDLNTALLEDPELSAWVVNRTPARRWGTPADLAGPAVWLASSASDFVNGQLIFVDGGMTAVI
jgi:gluconate 5-dehydrogenase